MIITGVQSIFSSIGCTAKNANNETAINEARVITKGTLWHYKLSSTIMSSTSMCFRKAH